MSETTNHHLFVRHSPVAGRTSATSADPTGPNERAVARDHDHLYGLVADTDGRILLVDAPDEFGDRRLSQVTAETFRAPIPIHDAETSRLRVPRTSIDIDSRPSDIVVGGGSPCGGAGVGTVHRPDRRREIQPAA